MRALLSVTQVLGRLLLIFSLTYLMPFACALIYGDGTRLTFFASMLACIGAGGLLMLLTRKHRAELKARDGFILVSLAWTLTAAIATVPLLLHQEMSFTCLLYTSPSPRDGLLSRMPSSA